jgi:hypothetical protein
VAAAERRRKEMRHLSTRKIAWLVIALPALFVILSALIVAAVHGEAAAEGGPTGAEVLDRFVEASGGLKAYDAIENRKATASLSIPLQGMTFNVTVWSARPGNAYTLIESDMLGKIEKGVSGDVVWEKSIMTGPVIKEGSEREAALREAVFEKFIYWRDSFEKAELQGEETVGGADCWKVLLSPETGDPFTIYFDKESGLIMRVDTVAETEMGKIPVEAHLSDYREQDGIMMSFKTIVKVLGQDRIFTTSSVEHNVDMPEGIFDLPDDIKVLQK